MGKFRLAFSVVLDKKRLDGNIWAWKFGDWNFSTKWTSDSSPDADFDTANAANGLKKAKSVLMLAVPPKFSAQFDASPTFGTLEIHTFKQDDSSNTPFRTAAYHSAKVLTTTPRDFSTLPKVSSRGNEGSLIGSAANYSEVLLSIEGGVTVTP